MAADNTRTPMRRKRALQRQRDPRDCTAAPTRATRIRLVPHRVPSPIAWPQSAIVRLRSGRVAHVAVTPRTWPASAAATQVRVPRWRSAAPPARIMAPMPRSAVARKWPGTAPTEEKIDHQWEGEGEGLASRTLNWSRHTRYEADKTLRTTVTTAVAGAWESQRTVRRASEEIRSQKVRSVAASGVPIMRRRAARCSGSAWGDSNSTCATMVSSQAVPFSAAQDTPTI